MARFSLGVLNADQGKYEAAAAHYFERYGSTRATPWPTRTWASSFEHGKVRWGDGSTTQARQLNSRYADAHNGLGTILSRHQRYAEALAHFAAAIKINQSDPNAYNESAMIMAACPEAEASRWQEGRGIRDPGLRAERGGEIRSAGHARRRGRTR